MVTHGLSVVCAWCSRVVQNAPAGAVVTHTICPACMDWTEMHPKSRTGSPGADVDGVKLPAGYFGDD